jgi:hypothetical protein
VYERPVRREHPRDVVLGEQQVPCRQAGCAWALARFCST